MDWERIFLWTGFNIFVLGMLALDLGVFHRKAHVVSMREAALWSAVWIALALVFNVGIYLFWGRDPALEFFTGYVIEKSLSVDNLFVFLMIFHYFATPAEYQHRILFWGIVGALIMRAIFIVAGASLLENFHWTIYVFGGFLIITGLKMLAQGDHKIEPARNPAVRLMRRLLPITAEYEDQRFFVRKNGRCWATPLLLVLVVVETTDVVFAVDSIPAIFAITRDPFIVYTSNVFAILGLRALYFLLAGVLEMFRYLKIGLSLVLCFVGTKMVIVDVYEIPIVVSLGVVASILGLAFAASLIARPSERPAAPARRLSAPARAGSGPVVICGALAAAAAALFMVKWASIGSGPSWHAAATAIRLAESEIAEAKWIYGGALRSRTGAAEQTLERAWSYLQQDRFREAIDAAREARDTVRGGADDILSRN
ncbi:MAG TPA: TerC family protein [candidate division Zixibacteria bacterium]|nr:TerC family protein [candidate division Zixibacteria bacterium]